MTGKDPRTVSPSEILGRVQASTSGSQLARKLLRRIEPPGTPNAKMRLGLVVTFDPTTWTCTAMIGDQLTQVSGIKVLAGVVPVANCAGYFAQVGGDSTTEYTLIGVLSPGPGNVRIRKTADQSVNNSAASQFDTDLKFQAQAGRTYLVEVLLIASKTGTEVASDFKLGLSMPSGATWSGGGLGPISSLAGGSAGESTGAGANWRAFSNTTGFIVYGIDISNQAVSIQFHGSVKMAATSGLVTVFWGQNVAGGVGITTTVKEGSYLKADMTSEYIP